MLIEKRRNESYICTKSSTDQNAGKSTPEPWYQIDDNKTKPGDCKGKNTNTDCVLMNILDYFLLPFVD